MNAIGMYTIMYIQCYVFVSKILDDCEYSTNTSRSTLQTKNIHESSMYCGLLNSDYYVAAINIITSMKFSYTHVHNIRPDMYKLNLINDSVVLIMPLR